NDAAAMAAATTSIAVSGAAEIAIEAADVYLRDPSIAAIGATARGGRDTLATIRRSLRFSLTYNVLAGTLAAAGLIHPLIAAPLVATLIASSSLAGGLLAIGACCAFAANEPLLVLLGHRGKRARARDGARARRWLGGSALLAALAGGAGLWLAPAARLPAVIVAVPALLLVVLAWKRVIHTLAGELVAVVV